MDNPSANEASGWRSPVAKIAAVVGVVTIAAVAFWMLTPLVVDHLASSQFDQLQHRTGLDIEADGVETEGVDGLQIRDLQIRAPDDDRTIVAIDAIDASVDLWRSLRGRPTVRSADIEGVDIALHRRADGSTDLDTLREAFGADGDDDRSDAAPPDDPFEAITDRLLARFGGQFPAITVRDARLETTRDDEAPPWPIRDVATDEFTLQAGDDEADFATRLQLTAPNNPDLTIPEDIEISGTLRQPLDSSSLVVDPGSEFRVANLARFPFAEFGVAGLELTDDGAVELTDPTVASRLQKTSQRLADAQRIRIQLDRWPLSASDISVNELDVDAPRLHVDFDTDGGSNITDLYSVARQPSARAVATTARAVGDSVALAETDDAETDVAASPAPAPGLLDRLADLPVRDLLVDHLPSRTRISDFRLVVDDARTHDQLTRPAQRFEITGDRIAFQHDPVAGLLEGDIQLQTEADDETGNADIQFDIPYRTGNWNASVDVDSIQLAHFAQLGGPRVARHLHGGEISSRLDIEHAGGDEAKTSFDGLIVGNQMRAHLAAVAEDPIAVPSASLQFDGFYDGTIEIPEAQLVAPADDEDDEADDQDDADSESDDDNGAPDQPPESGGFVIESATARLADVEADFGLAVWGLDGLTRPDRLDVDVQLEQTELQQIIDAVPAALRGPLDGLQMQGSLAWNFNLEVPLWRATDMAWEAHVDISPDLEVVSIPEQVDVFGITDEFEHTIEDDWQETINYRDRDVYYERTVTIPEMRPTPADWMIENTSLDLEELDDIRRERQWPEIPPAHASSVDASTLESPDYWLTDEALDEAADIPWETQADDGDDSLDLFGAWPGSGDDADDQDDDELVWEQPDPPEPHEFELQADPDRHGPYVYVPLHHISPYMVRAIKTTEDNSFFTHDGFNFLAIRQSVEQNLDAGRFVRGASTISMQLAKNLFLDRDRVLARKLQEITLVWLMESVADIPKARMMELYLNIIEFGPGVYGIHEAAMHYFGKRPSQLTVDEVAWLVSIVPNPKYHHRYYDRGEITSYWFHRMTRYIRAMEARNRISEAEKQRAVEEAPAFYIPDDGDPLLRDDVEPIDPDDIETDDEDDEDEEETELPPDFE